MTLGRKIMNLWFLQEISFYNLKFSEKQNFLKKSSENTAVVWKRECNSFVTRKMENLLRVWNGSAASAEKSTLQVHTWFLYCSFCKEGHATSTRFTSLFITVDTERATLQITRDIFTIVSAGRNKLQVQMWFSYYCFCR
jgi:hypothetical protein